MDLNSDNENYWNCTSSRAFSFDNDDDSNNGNECSASAIGTSRPIQEITYNDTLLEANFNYEESADALELNMTVETLVSEQTLKTILDEQQTVDNYIPVETSLRDEIKLLRRQLLNTLHNPDPEWTVRKLLAGKVVNLEAYKSFEAKEQLLDTCLENGCAGDAIISILLHLEKTLNKDLLYKILKERPIALNHYINYLEKQEQNECFDKLIETLKATDKHYLAFLLQYDRAFDVVNIDERKIILRKLQDEYFQGDAIIPQKSFYQNILKASLDLCEILKKMPSKESSNGGVNLTPIEVLYATCAQTNNGKNKESLLSTPLEVADKLQIPREQFEWALIHERARAEAYVDLEQIFEQTLIWLPGKEKQFQMHIPIESVILRLYELNVPNSVLYRFFIRMSNTMEKLELAEKVKCIKAVIDVLMYNKDAEKLLTLYDTLLPRTEEYLYCERALKNVQSKR